MFSHKSTPNFSTAESETSLREPFCKRLSSAFQVLVHGERPPQSPQPPLDPRIVAAINHHAEFIAETYDDPLAGSFAHDILTESAYVIVDSCGIPTEETVSDVADSEVTADLLTQSRRHPR